MSPQTGLPQNNRVGDFDPFALPMVMKHFQLTLEQALQQLGNQGGLLGLSDGLSGDIRDLESAAKQGHAAARLALDTYVSEIRRHLGGMMMALGGADAIVFTGGIGENGKQIRRAICDGLDDFGIALDMSKNESATASECRVDRDGSRVQLWLVPTNEELIVARQTLAALQS